MSQHLKISCITLKIRCNCLTIKKLLDNIQTEKSLLNNNSIPVSMHKSGVYYSNKCNHNMDRLVHYKVIIQGMGYCETVQRLLFVED